MDNKKKSLFSFNTKYLKTGGYSVLISIVAIAIVIVINLFVNKLPTSLTQIDTTSTDLHSISEKTISAVKAVNEDVTVYYISTYGSEDTDVQSVLAKYKELNEKVKVEQIDPAVNPAFFSGEREDLIEHSIVVESAKRSKIITYFDIFYPGYTEDMLNSYYYYYGTLPEPSFNLEKNLTSAIKYVTTDDIPVVYALKGHNELELTESYIEEHITSESMELKQLNLATVEYVPTDCDCLLICVPETDISADEAERILTYLKSGGKMMYVSYYSYTSTNSHTNLMTVLNYYGVTTVDGYIVEGGDNYKISGAQGLLIPSYGSHDVVAPLSGISMILGNAQGIKQLEDIRSTVTITPLLSTSSDSYSKVGSGSSATKEESDINGPFDIAVAVSELNDDGTETQIIWINDPTIMLDNLDLYGASGSMVTNSLGWMCEIDSAISIPDKKYESEILEINELQGNLLMWIFAVIIPVSVMGIGFVVIYRRRSK